MAVAGVAEYNINGEDDVSWHPSCSLHGKFVTIARFYPEPSCSCGVFSIEQRPRQQVFDRFLASCCTNFTWYQSLQKKVSAYSAFSNIYESFTDQMATENTSAAVGAASSAIGSSVQVENEALQLHGADHPVEAYYTKLRRLWDELGVLMLTPQCTCNGCTCGLSKAVSDLALFTQLMQFLMGLGEMFDHVRHQLLVMDSIPSVNRAYSMDVGYKGDQKRRSFVDKRQQFCEHCVKSGHTKHMCFKIHSTSDWYKDLVEQKRKDGNGSGSGRNFAANTEERKVQPHLNEDSKELLLKELIKLVRGSGTQPEPIQQVNFAQLDDFAGMNCTLTRLGDIDLSYWIVDTGATNHICASPHILSNLVNPSIPTTVHLPDDTNTLFDSRDVMFHETTYPFQSTPPETDPVSLSLPTIDTEPIIDPPTSSLAPTDSLNGFPTVPVSPNISPSDISIPLPSLTRPQRNTSKPAWMNDYVCSCAASSSSCIPDSFSLAHICFVTQCSSTQELKTYLQASKDASWVATMQEELQALDKNGTWELSSLPPAKRAIGSWWVFKLKLPPDGSIARYKARLVAKGYNQIEGVDYFDSFSSVAKSVTVRILMGIAAAKSWPLFQLDINNAFLHGHLDEEVYMDPPEGYTIAQPGQMFYVDDILLTGTSEGSLNEVKQYLDKLFTIKDLGSAKYFLGLELARSTHGLHVTQHKYLQDILRDASMLTSTPFPSSMHLNNEEGALLHSPDRYRPLVGRLLYLGFTRPDLSFPVQQLSQFMQHPRTSHWDAALHVLSYLKGTCTLGLFFPSQSSLHLSAYSDAA
ncbi:UNVERIFIED_CONTAM: Retrovirus-related Pol polyprotein from transposon RE2 [Sesamum calycinum]|uniref:Retrovirus-related Pol polyprotein from transposon RE2 n=1 Tax=Sesamum calycinum TaxID=2727403 RepID=A0AAW2Q3Q5_9LAMI